MPAGTRRRPRRRGYSPVAAEREALAADGMQPAEGLHALVDNWNHGSAIRSWLIELMGQALADRPDALRHRRTELTMTTPVAHTSIDDVSVPDELARRLARLTGGPPPATLADLASTWAGQLRDGWREMLLTDTPTVHRVEIDRQSYPVNCALDGLLLPRLARTDGTLTTQDPTTKQTLTVQLTATGTHTTSHPWVVLALGIADGSDDVHACACPHINLFVDRPALDRWREQHPSVATLPLPLAEAIGLADRLAGDGPPITLA